MSLIFDIKRFAINDGPGIRTTLFLKGCPLRCVWCHNPESWTPSKQVLYKRSKCIGCRSCVDICPQHALTMTSQGIRLDTDACTLCSACTGECPTKALEMCGLEWPMSELMDEVEKERAVMEDSHGGVTLCGGEPLMHPLYTLELLHELGRRGFHRTVDTTLFAPTKVVADVAEACELMLVDLKMMDSEKHRCLTGQSNEIILQNIRFLAENGYDFFIRIPLIEGVNTDEQNMVQTACFLKSLSWKRKTVNLLPYHDVGKDKHRRLWSIYNPNRIPMDVPSESCLHQCAEILKCHGLNVVVGG